MSHIQYYVVGDHDVWMVKAKDGEHGHGTSRSGTAALAIRAAQKLGMRGECAHVCVVDDDGSFRLKWTYNRDRRLCRSASGHRKIVAGGTRQCP